MRLLRPAQLQQQLVARDHSRVGLSRHGLQTVQHAEGFLIVSLGYVYVHQTVVEFAFLREVAQQGLIYLPRELRTVCGGVELAQAVTVPIVGRIQCSRFPERQFGGLIVLHIYAAHTQIEPGGIVVRCLPQQTAEKIGRLTILPVVEEIDTDQDGILKHPWRRDGSGILRRGCSRCGKEKCRRQYIS